MTDLRALDAIRARHWPVPNDSLTICGRDEGIWPCDTATLLAEVDRLRAEPTAIINLGAGMPEFEQGVRDLWERAEQSERARIREAVEGLPATPYYTGDYEAAMCPNCVTPWKCNGPHELTDREPAGWEVDRAAVLALLGDER